MAVDFVAALKTSLIDLQRAGPHRHRSHCTLDELRAYHRRRLPDDRQEEIADHLVLCGVCRSLLLHEVLEETGPAASADLPVAVPAGEVAEAWNRLRSCLDSPAPEGVQLAHRLAAGRLPGGEAVRLMLAIARAVAALHARGLVLHSVCAANVLIASSGQVRLLDRGVAPTPESFELDAGTRAEDVLSDLYRVLAPEQVVGEVLTPRSNLFALGTLFYEMVTGTSPFCDTTPVGTLSRVLSLIPPSPSELDPTIDPCLSGLIDRLLEKEPDDRPETAEEVVRILTPLVVPRSLSDQEGNEAIEDRIERLYEHIQALVREPGTPVREREVERAFSRLRELQEDEARAFRQQFESALNLPLDAGVTILARARALRKELEDLTSPDPAAPHTDRP